MKKMKDYAHLYLGCDIMVGNNKWTLDAVYLDGIQTGLQRFPYTQKIGFDEFKLILRPISEITEEEIEVWNNIQTPIGEMAIESAQQIHWTKRINYYRSIGLDCDSLIESGIATIITQ